MPEPPSHYAQNGVRVFLSYAWESEEYRTLVKRFAKRLIADGIDARLDAWHVRAGQTIPAFMSSENRHADKILIVCSPEYRRKVHAMEDGDLTTGVGYESMLVSSTLWTGQRGRDEVEVALLQGSARDSIPDFLGALDYVDLTDPGRFERNYRELLRRLTGRRERAPQRGHLPDLTPDPIEPLRGSTETAPPLEVQPPGLVNLVLDRASPALNRALTRTSRPAEYRAVTEHMRALRGQIYNDIAKKNYIPNAARRVVTGPSWENSAGDPFVRPIHQIIRGLAGRSEGGDSATAQIAAVNRRSRVIRNIVKTLLKTDEPLMLLGDPGTGKSLTLQQAAIALIDSELAHVYPRVPLFIRLGEFHRDSHPTAGDVLDYVTQSAPPGIRPWIDALDRAGRLVILFDGMDEMSRQLYTAHTEALSEFASSRRGLTKTLFSCRITDFSPSFVHQRLVLLPFDESQIAEYLHRYFLAKHVVIEGERWKIRKLARRLLRDTLAVEASNPFTLWLLCFHFAQNGNWPASRAALLESYLEEVYRRKSEDADPQLPFPPRDEVMSDWAEFAYLITTRNRGSAIPRSELQPEAVRMGRLCGVLAETAESDTPLVRFEHHRLQEYFAARHIRDANPPMEWLDKLDAPRWQETILNLVLMGGGDEAVEALASAISSEIREAPGTPLAPDRELLLADRVELAARIARAGNASQTAATLMPTVVGSVDFLMTHGNPITQMKMMRACIHLPDPELLTALRRPLTSPVNWLREQALILLSASEQRGGASLAAEIGYDLANGALPIRIPAYIRAIRASHQRGGVRSLLLGFLALLIDLFACVAIGAVLYRVVVELAKPGKPDQWLTPVYEFMTSPSGAGATAAIAILAAVVVIRRAPEYLWAAVVGTALAMPLLTFAVPELWRAPAQGALLFLGVIVALWLIAAPLISMAAGSFRSLAAAGYFLATRSFRDQSDRARLFVRGSWDRSGFLWWTKHKATVTPFLYIMGGGGGLLLIGLVVGLIDRLLELLGFIGSTLHLDALAHSAPIHFLGELLPGVFGVVLVLVIVFYGLAFLVAAVSFVYRLIRNKEFRLSKWIAFRGWIKYRGRKTAKVVSVVSAIALLAWIIARFGPLLARALSVGISLAAVVLLAILSYKLWRASFGQPYSFRPKSFTESSWRAALEFADPYEQEYIIDQTNHETLGLNPSQFLAALQSAQPLIKAEPAVSTYWARRADLEQVLKQERRG